MAERIFEDRLHEPDPGMSLKGPKVPGQPLPDLPPVAAVRAEAAGHQVSRQSPPAQDEVQNSPEFFQKSQTQNPATPPPAQSHSSDPGYVVADPAVEIAPAGGWAGSLALSFDGNVYTHDPQYTADGAPPKEAPSAEMPAQPATGLYIAILGDPGSAISLRARRWQEISGEVGQQHATDRDVASTSATQWGADLAAASANFACRILVLAVPPGPRDPDPERCDFQKAVGRTMAEVASELQGWLVVVVAPPAAAFFKGSAWRSLRKAQVPGTWRTSTLDLHGLALSLHSRGFASRPLLSESLPSLRRTDLSAVDLLERATRDAVEQLIRTELSQDIGSHLESVHLVESGKVKRHVSRGAVVYDEREQKQIEDERSWAGARDPSRLHDTWPQLWDAMAPIARLLLDARQRHSDLQNLRATLGPKPPRAFPASSLISDLRTRVGQQLGLTASQADEHHWSSPWRYQLVQRVQQLSFYRDLVIGDWLKKGAPMGIRKTVHTGRGAYPLAETIPTRTPEDVQREPPLRNHPSFLDPAGQPRPPGVDLIEGHMNSSFGMLFENRQAASDFLQTPAVSAPLGCVTKEKEGVGSSIV